MKLILRFSSVCVLLISVTVQAQVTIRTVQSSVINEHGIYQQSERFNEIRVSSTEAEKIIEAENKLPLEKGLQKFDHAYETSVSLSNFSTWKTVDSYAFSRIRIAVSQAPTLRLYFDRLVLPDSAEAYIYNEQGTTILGPISKKDNSKPNQLWGTCIFPGEAIFIEMKVLSVDKSKLDISLRKIMFGFRKDEIRAPRLKNDTLSSASTFGSSSPCNVNVLCAPGAGYANERSAVALILAEGGKGSGFMINDVCGTRQPHFLTAYHNTVSRNPANWQFIFHYWSPTCSPNQNGSFSLLFNGASLSSSWIQTDFALLYLNQTPSITSGISYLGWSRSTVAPTNSVGIHHPSGDVMKIAVENSAAVVGNVQGYLNTGWRVQFDNGIVEPGSSGSPLLNQNKLVVGQLYSNTQPSTPCFSASGGSNYGKFDLSWAGGGTAVTRVSNFLDPSSTGATSIPTLNPSTQLSIIGPELLCTSQTYSFPNLPPGYSVSSWVANPASSVSISATGATATVTKVNPGIVTLYAVLMNSCGLSTTVSKVLNVGAPVTIIPTIQVCDGGSRNWFLSAGPVTNMTSWYWTVSSGSGITIYSPSSPSTLVGVTGGGSVQLTYTDICGISKSDGITVYNNGCTWLRIIPSPNPAKGKINVSIVSENQVSSLVNGQQYTANIVSGIDSKGKTIISLYEVNTKTLIKRWKYSESETSSYSLDIAGLRKGIYAVQLDRNNLTTVSKIIIE